MKYILAIVLLLFIGVLGYTLWPQTPPDAVSGTWDAQMEIFPFERAPTTQLTLHWKAPEQSYNHFVLSISDEQGQLLRKESGEHDRLSLDPDALEPNTTYLFSLQACLDPNCTTWLVSSEEVRGTTASTSEEEVEARQE
ncbi:fibronectin type III domain-containing protein [Candidatus Uhrbacteria bacterium]|nr:fibronectin type III domain-containing protein [Candidatus Uhrbacteria bacterium]